MAVRKRGASYLADFMVKGVRYREAFATEKAAERWEEDAREALAQGRPIPAVVSNVTQGGGRAATLEDALRETLKHNWKDAKDSEKLAANVRCFVNWHGAQAHPSTVTTEVVDRYITYLRDALGNSNSTVNRKLSALRVVLKRALRLGMIKTLPLFERQKESTNGSLNYFDFGEEDPILSKLQHRGYDQLYDLVVFLIDTGARISEALKVEYATISNGRVRFDDRKNGQFGVVPLTKRAAAAIERRRTRSKHPERPFGDIAYKTGQQVMREVYDSLGGKYALVTQPFHVFRHSCASRLAIRGVDANRIKEWMDHSSLTVTQRYMKLSTTALEDAVTALEPAKPALKVVRKRA